MSLHILQKALYGYIFGFWFAGIGNFILETILYHIFELLHSLKLVRQYNPQIPRLETSHYRSASFFATAYGYAPVFAILFATDAFNGYSFSNIPSFPYWFYYVSTRLFVHDTWFFLVHHTTHSFPRLYKLIHAAHHTTHGDLSPYATAYGDWLDILFPIASFHGLLVLLDDKNPYCILGLFIVEMINNATGHSGYAPSNRFVELLICPVLGVLPFRATTMYHYLHHVDPKYNRGLYFTVWDDWIGTKWMEKRHPRIVVEEF